MVWAFYFRPGAHRQINTPNMNYPTTDSKGTSASSLVEFLGIAVAHKAHPDKVYVVEDLTWFASTDELGFILVDTTDGMKISITTTDFLLRIADGRIYL